jgi:hypothetical protein
MRILKITILLLSVLFSSCFNNKDSNKNNIENQENKNIETKENKKLQFLYFSNGGLIGYFDDGTIVGCPRCDLMAENIEAIKTREPHSKFKLENGILISEQGDSISINSMRNNEWAIVNYKNILNTTEDISKTFVALKFINDYVANTNKMKESTGIVEWVNSNEDVSKKFKIELTKMIEDAYKSEPEYGLGFDPIFDAQDRPDDGFKLYKFDTISNYLTVEGKSWKDFTVRMKIKEVNSKWLVDGCGVINIPENEQAER